MLACSAWLPHALGGPELPPFEFMRVVEAASALDGSVGWLVGNGGGMCRIRASRQVAAAREGPAGSRALLGGAAAAVGNAPARGGEHSPFLSSPLRRASP